MPASWLWNIFQEHKSNLFSANVRDYLGSRRTDKNINEGIKETTKIDAGHLLIYNNGITALVNKFEPIYEKGSIKKVKIQGISIINGAQTTGAIGSLETEPTENALVQIRFIKSNAPDTVDKIRDYNNRQNKINAPDFRSMDPIQRNLLKQFEDVTDIEYQPRRGGFEDVIRRRPNILLSITAGQALAAFMREPKVAYHQKAKIWEDDSLYSKFFNEHTTAKNILLAYSLLRAVELKKSAMVEKNNRDELSTEVGQEQLQYFRKRGSIFLFVSAVSNSLEIILEKGIPNIFKLEFRDNLSPNQAIAKWEPIEDISTSFIKPLSVGLADGIRNDKSVNAAIAEFEMFIGGTQQANERIFKSFKELIIL